MIEGTLRIGISNENSSHFIISFLHFDIPSFPTSNFLVDEAFNLKHRILNCEIKDGRQKN